MKYSMELLEKLQLAYTKIKAANRILLVSHISPDADALASLGAMIEVSIGFGSKVFAYADKKSSGAYDFIPNENLISGQAPDDLKTFDVILILDCGSISRTGIGERLKNLIRVAQEGALTSRPYIIEFDHHLPQDNYADLEIRLHGKASTTEIIYQFLKVNNLEITKSLANCILIGLMTDTGHFLHANSSREAIAIASEMLLRGASFPKMIQHTVYNKSFISLKIWGRALENMHFNSETGLASSGLTAEELSELLRPIGAEIDADLFADIASFLSTLSGVRVALLLREENGRVKGSLRTNDDETDVAALAQNWGGGGHKKAAGFSMEGRLVKTDAGWKVVK